MKIIVIQARMGSTRLPGKVLKTIKGVPLLKIQYDRIANSKNIDKIIVATTSNEEDAEIEELCLANNILCYRGSDWDVLSRYYFAVLPYKPEVIIRITSDCTLHHSSVIDFVLNEYEKSGKDYFSNSNNEPDYLEDGFDVEVFSFKALETAWREAKLLSEREHVTPFIKNSGQFSCGWKKFKPNYHFKLSVDTPNDFKLITEIVEHFDSLIDFDMDDVIALLNQKPALLAINEDSIINSGYRKSIDNDKEIS